ncbi:MAG: efflux RND transporter periplasmic adaptor subunit [Bacteroidota bacterium]
MKKSILFIIPVVLVISLLAVFQLSGNSEAESKAKKTRRVMTEKARQIAYQETIFATGKLSSKEEIKLSFKTGGVIHKIYVAEGQKVRKGQLLAELKLDEIRAQTQQAELGSQQAEIAIENARLAVRKAERDFKNAEGLYKDSVATFDDLDNARLQLDNARNQLEAAQTSLKFNKQNEQIADFNLAYSKITAPANGVILRKLAEASELTGSGQPIFLFGSNNQAQVIRVNLTDKDIIHVEMGDEARIEFDAYPQTTFEGRVVEMARIADPYMNTFEVEILVDSDGKKLLSGFIGSVHIQTRSGQSLVSVPVDALINADQSKGIVFTLKGDTAVKTPIEIYKLQKGEILIKGGLSEGAEVVVKGGGYLEDGEIVSR